MSPVKLEWFLFLFNIHMVLGPWFLMEGITFLGNYIWLGWLISQYLISVCVILVWWLCCGLCISLICYNNRYGDTCHMILQRFITLGFFSPSLCLLNFGVSVMVIVSKFGYCNTYMWIYHNTFVVAKSRYNVIVLQNKM